MVTEVVMRRELFGGVISQKSTNGFLSATDLQAVGNKWRLQNDMPMFQLSTWLQSPAAKEFIAELEKRFGQVKINSKGKGHHTWVHPYLFIDMALAISPALKVEVYSWLYDHLIQYRNDSGDSYKRMAGALYGAYPNKSKFPHFIVTVAELVRKEVGVKDWQEANEGQLKLRDKIHDNVSLLCDIVPCDDAVRIGIKKALDGK